MTLTSTIVGGPASIPTLDPAMLVLLAVVVAGTAVASRRRLRKVRP
ncbi:MAG: IPTL-CTERM sorting domain-containing protein [Betaproteobacteria bacterium]|nr:IPTL-CTERM sorting domain-containing protein [Betaproteobacteria bacterium]